MDVSNDRPFRVKPRRRRGRWLIRLGLLILVFVAVQGGRDYWHHRQVSDRLAEAVAELDRTDPGWRLEQIEAARKEVPDEENSALRIVAAGKLLPSSWPANDFGHAFGDIPPQEQLAPDEVARLEAELEQRKDALAIARELARLPWGRYHVEYQRNTLNILLPDLQTARMVAQLLEYDAMRWAQAGDLNQALIDCRAMLNAGRSVGDEPMLMSQLVRMACVNAACRQTERVLAQGEPPADELETLQRALGEESLNPDMQIGLRGERALFHHLFDGLECGDVQLSELSGGRPGWTERVFWWRVRDVVRREHPILLSCMAQAIANSRLPLHEQAAAERRFEAEILDLPPEAPLTRLVLPSMTKVSAGYRDKQAHLRCLMSAIACERYRQAQGKWPESLADLVPEYLPGVPTDPQTGQAIHFRRLGDGLLLYTVGSDGSDDGGTLFRANPTQPGTDLGIRLWDPGKRRQPPSPRPPKPDDPLAPPE